MLALYTAVYVGLSTSGLLLLRRSLSRGGGDNGPGWHVLREPQLLVGGALYVLSFLTFLLALRRFQLSLVYPVFVASGYIAVVLGAWVVLDEHFSLSRGVGVALVAAGLIFVTR